jgi:hypothetical protein
VAALVSFTEENPGPKVFLRWSQNKCCVGLKSMAKGARQPTQTMNTTDKLASFAKSDLESVHDGMEDGGHISDAIFGARLISDIKDNLSQITIDELVKVGISRLESEIFVCAVAASGRSDWNTTQHVLYWSKK